MDVTFGLWLDQERKERREDKRRVQALLKRLRTKPFIIPQKKAQDTN